MKRKAFISAFAALLAFLVMASIVSMALSASQRSEADTILFESQIAEQRFQDAPWFLLKAAEDWRMDYHCNPALNDVSVRTAYLEAAAALMSSEGVSVTVNSHNYGKSGGPPPAAEYAYLDVTLTVESHHVSRTALVHVEERYCHDVDPACPNDNDFTFGSNTVTVTC